MSQDWCTIESDPGVFTELLEEIGVANVELEELWSLDDETLQSLVEAGPIYGLIFLFQWKPGHASSSSRSATTSTSAAAGATSPLTAIEAPPNLFFARQVTTNACATQAILSVVLNAQSLRSDLGTTLTDFVDFTSTFPPHLKGEAIGASDVIREAHNSFARKDAFLHDPDSHTRSSGKSDDVFHFVAYLPFEGKVYELDGLQQGPMVVGSVDDQLEEGDAAWCAVARTAIQDRMEVAGGDIKFNLMAVVQDRRVALHQKLQTLSPEALEYGQVHADLVSQEAKRHEWKLENQRRKHNYVPLCIQLLKELARAGTLPQLVTDANDRTRAAKSAKRAKH